ncbi:hypothetical protein FALCPG4_011464 [Fusarium falciforme]
MGYLTAVPIQYAKVLLSASLIGYFLPTVLMFIPWSDSEAAQIWRTFWQPSPVYVPLLTMVFGALYRWYRPLSAKEKRSPCAKDEPADLALLNQLYIVIGVLGVLVHWYVLLSLVNHDTLSFTRVSLPNYSMSPMPLDQAFLDIFSVGFRGFFSASYVWCVCTTWDLRRVGRAEVDLAKASLVILVAHLALGPGAAMSAVWYWREDKMAVCFFPAARKEHKE